jgi:hypothetical protein
MAPSGYKTFSAGAILTATADVQNYLMDQVVSVHNDASARSSAISSPAEGQVSYLKDTNLVYLYNGSAWVEVGGGIEWSGSTANGLATYGSASTVVSESTATYDGTTLQLTTSGGGLKLDNLASSNANTLDDYEEGTATISFLPSSGTITMDATTCRYTKIGNLVTLTGQIIVDSVSTPSGNTKITGLPFATVSGTSGRPIGGAVIGSYSGTIDHALSLLTGASQTTAWIYEAQGLLQGERFQANTEMQFTYSYPSDA